MKEFNNLIDALARRGFRIIFKRGHKLKVMIYGPNQQLYIAHCGPKAVQPIETWAKNKCGVQIGY